MTDPQFPPQEPEGDGPRKRLLHHQASDVGNGPPPGWTHDPTKIAPVDDPAPAAPWIPSSICTTCWELFGDQPGHRDACSCPDRRTPHDGSVTSAERGVPCRLCAVCALRVVRGHTRWRLHHCASCVPRVQALNARLGRLAVPVGIHSLVNGVSVKANPGQPRVSRKDAARFAAQLANIGRGGLRLDQYRTHLVRSRCERLGLVDGPAITLGRYLRACDAAGITTGTSWRAFLLGTTAHPN